ncbi:MAG: hypothetical protein JKY08_00025 [Flavobacteriaceae bacterium]|nr:hypothetical protein [Flavobacteriaceae bacterium]
MRSLNFYNIEKKLKIQIQPEEESQKMNKRLKSKFIKELIWQFQIKDLEKGEKK